MSRTPLAIVKTTTTFSPCKDFLCWSDNGQDAPASDMQWKFSSPHHHHASSSWIRFSVHYNTSDQTHTFNIHNNLAFVLGYLNTDYWLTVDTNQNDNNVEPKLYCPVPVEFARRCGGGAERCNRQCHVRSYF